MKSPGLVVILFSLMILSAAAQSNPSLVATNTVVGGRRMSLQDCIQEALAHNLDVQIQRYNPEIALYGLRAAYGGFDPTYNFSGTHAFNVQPGTIEPNGLELPSQTSKINTFNSGIVGTLPLSGLQYNFNGNINDGHFYSVDEGTNIFSRDGSGSIGVTLTQPLLKGLWIDNTRMTIKVDKITLRNNEEGFRGQVITSVTAVENAYYNLIYQLENVKVQQEAVDLAQTQLDQDKQRMQIGTLAQLSVEQDESQLAQDKATLITAESQTSGAEVTLKNLLTDNYPAWQDVEIQPTEPLAAPLVLFNLQDSWSKALSERPDLLQARLNVESQGVQLKFLRNQLFPELDVIGSYGWNGAGAVYNGTFGQINQGSAPSYSYEVQLSVPLANQNARNLYKSGKVTLKQLLLQLKQKEQSIMTQVDNDVANAQSYYQSVQATREARIYAEAALAAEQKTYAVGKATTFEVLQYQNSLTTARGQEIQALANYEEALATLDGDEGSTLEKLGINIEAN
jgi:outer membrane protein TolC